MRPYVILLVTEDKDEPLYWNNEMGWGDWLSATVFTQDEKNTLHLPVDGAWKRILIKEREPNDE